MRVVQVIILGMVQGLTEFLPVSSSGHLVLAQSLFGIADQGVFFEVILHFATLFAILVYFRKQLLALRGRDLYLLFLATLPAGAVGFLLHDWLVESYQNVSIAASMLILSGLVNILIQKKINNDSYDQLLSDKPPSKAEVNQVIQISGNSAFKIGLFQMVALLPGLTRSGTTVYGGLRQGLSREKAFEFSFLMAIPVVIGANTLELLRAFSSGATNMDFGLLEYSASFIAAFICGMISLRIVHLVLQKAKFSYFAIYCFIVGSGALLLHFVGFY